MCKWGHLLAWKKLATEIALISHFLSGPFQRDKTENAEKNFKWLENEKKYECVLIRAFSLRFVASAANHAFEMFVTGKWSFYILFICSTE